MRRTTATAALLVMVAIATGQWIEKSIWLPESIHSVSYTNVFACDSTGAKAYLSGWDAERLQVFDVAARRKVKSFEFEMGTALVSVPSARRIYALSPDRSEVWMIDDRTDSVVNVCDELDGPYLGVFASGSDKVYVGTFDDDYLFAFRPGPDTLVARIGLADMPVGLEYDPVTDRVFVLLSVGDEDGLLVVDPATDSMVAFLPAVPGYCSGLAVHPGRRRIYSFGRNEQTRRCEIWVYDADSLRVVARHVMPVEWGLWAARFTLNFGTDYLYAANWDYGGRAGRAGRRDYHDDSIAVVNCRTDSFEGFVVMPAGNGVWHLAADSADGKTYVSPAGGDGIAVMAVPDSITGWIPLPGEGAGINWIPVRNELLVAADNDTLYVVDCPSDSIAARVSYSSLYAADLFFNPAGAKLYFLAYRGVGFIDPGDTFVKFVPASPGQSLNATPLAYSAELNRLYLGGYDRLFTFDCNRDTFRSSDSFGVYLAGPGLLLPDLHKLYLPAGYNCYVYDIYLDSLVDSIVDAGTDLKYNPRNGLVYGNRYFNQVSITDPRHDSVIGRLTVYNVTALEVNPEQNEVYASYYYGVNNAGLMVIDGLTHRLSDTIRLPSQPGALKWMPTVNKLYALSAYGDSLFVIDCRTHELTRIVLLAPVYATFLTPNLRNDKLYITSPYGGLTTLNCRWDSVIGYIPEALTWIPPVWDPARNRLYLSGWDHIIVIADDMTGIEQLESIEACFAVGQNPSAGPIRFSLPGTAPCRIAVFDAAGRLTWSACLPAGARSAVWDRLDAQGRRAAAGVYLARLESASGSNTVKVVLR